MRSSIALALVFVACGSPPPDRHEEVAEGTGDEVVVVEDGSDAAPLPADARMLAPGATFAALADAARHQDQLRDQDSTAGCILTPRAGAFHLSSDLAVAVRPLPEPEVDLDARMASRDPVRVLTRYGSYGETGTIGLSAMTTTAPPDRAVALVVFLTDRGAYARRTDEAFGDVVPRPAEALAGVLPFAEVATTFVAAEAGVPVESIAAFLRLLPSTLAGNVGLAVALAPGTVLPATPALEEEETVPVCDALPDAPADATEGSLEAADIVAALGPLRASAAICVGATSGPGARGGRLVLSARIDASGRVIEACISADSTDDAHLRACVLRAARGLVFPEAGGLVDFALPLSLAPGPAHHQRALCE